MRFLNQSDSFGSRDRPLRKYVALQRSLDRIMDEAYLSPTEGETLRLKLIRTWAFHTWHALKVQSIEIRYLVDGRQVLIAEGDTDPSLWKEAERLFETGPPTLFKDAADILVFQTDLDSVSARLTIAMRHRSDWSVDDVGWTGDSLELLQGVIGRARRRELERIAQRVTNRQTMLKELRPNSLYYNLLHEVGRAVGHNHSSLLVTCRDEIAIVAAETLRHSGGKKSNRIGGSVQLPERFWDDVRGSLKVCHGLSQGPAERMCEALYGSRWGSTVQTALFVPIGESEKPERLLVVLADSRVAYFSQSQQRDVTYVSKRTARVISNSVGFGLRLDEASRTLDEVILRSQSQFELVRGAAEWLRRTFEASAAQVVLPQTEADADATSGEHVDVLTTAVCAEHVHREKRASYLRHETRVAGQFEALFGAPLQLLDDEVGAVLCHYTKARQPSPFEQFLLEAAAQRIAAALTVRAVGDRQLADLRRVVRLMELVAAADDDQELLRTLTSEVMSFLGADYCFVSVPDHLGALNVQAKTWGDEFKVPPIRVTGLPGDGITGYVVHNRCVYRTGDVTADPYYRDVVSDGGPAGIRSEMAGPLVFEDRLLGVIDLMATRVAAFSEQAETLLRMLLTYTSVAIAQAERAKSGRDHIQLTNVLHAHLLRLTNADEIYAALLDAAIGLVGTLHPGYEIRGNLYVKHTGMRFLEAKAFVGEKSATFSPTQYFDEGVVGKVASSGQAVVISDTSKPPAGWTYISFIEGITSGSEIAVPTSIGQEVDAVINLESPSKGLFGPRDLGALEAFAHEVSLAVRFAQLNESAQMDKRRQAAEQELRFLRNLSHQVARSAHTTSIMLPQMEKMLADRPEALALLAPVRAHAEEAIVLEKRLVESFARPQPQYAMADVIAGLQSAVHGVRRQWRQVEVLVNVEPAAFEVAGLPEIINIVFENLFDNAIAAMDGRGRLTITEQPVPDQHTLVIDVTDSGRGIADENRERIWEPHFSDDGTGHSKGAGIGLWIVREHMTRMNSTVVLHESALGRGTTFRLTFAAR